jgi:hypothetical protein
LHYEQNPKTACHMQKTQDGPLCGQIGPPDRG